MANRMDAKSQALKEHGALNSRSQGVTDELFAESEFFDSRDLVLVKYEMLRRANIDGWSVTRAARAFGFSRVAFYQAKAAFEQEGLPGLIPKPRGPKQAHKITDAVLGFVDRCMTDDPTVRPPALSKRVQKQFGFSVHPRSIERALSRRQKKGR